MEKQRESHVKFHTSLRAKRVSLFGMDSFKTLGVVSTVTALMVALGGCASAPEPAPVVEARPVPTETVTLSTEANTESVVITNLEYRGIQLKNSTFDLPIEMNKAVEKWIDYFVGRGRKHFEKYLERSEHFIPFLRPILKNAKAPQDLVYLAMIESGFNNNARSNARAVGAWQFISATGRRYGLDVNWWVDERRDVEKSTIAAVQYLKELNVMFGGSWPLATAAYNAGEAKIQRAIAKYHTNNFWELCDKRRKYLKPETKNYVPKLFAAAIVSKNRKQFGFEEAYTNVKAVSAAGVTAKAEEKDDLERLPDLLDSDKAEAEAESNAEAAKADAPSNPADAKTQSAAVEPGKDSPADAEEAASLAADPMENMLRSMSNPVRTPHVNRNGEVNGDVLTEVEIPSPADLFKVANAAGLSYLEFKSMNPELSRWVTPPDVKTYRIRMPLSHKDGFMKKYFDPAFQREVTFLVYRARKGETPKLIARRFGISADPILDMNDVKGANSSFMPGTLVELPIPSDFVRSIASLKNLELLDPVYPKKRRFRRFKSRRRSRAASSSQIRFEAAERQYRM
ncbi:LysM peptidoglycan-binding domain-containing protein [bacterium]|jgi:hypothetical protein|nr:LysM peptidoglycan-binding domain-containing protein [bacterium]